MKDGRSGCGGTMTGGIWNSKVTLKSKTSLGCGIVPPIALNIKIGQKSILPDLNRKLSL
jgi:hypothetical protein